MAPEKPYHYVSAACRTCGFLSEKKEEVGEPYNLLLRHTYQEHLDRNAMYVELVDHLNELDRLEYDGLRFAADEDGWHKAS